MDALPAADSMPDFYCPLPFRHVFVDSTGVSACCQLPRRSMNIQHWIQSSELKNIQSQLTQGQVPVGCSVCVRQEKTQGHSLRTESLRDYGQQYFTDTDIDFVDYRASNICNFKCRSCGPAYSSAWVPDATKLGYTDQEKVWSIGGIGEQTNYDFLTDQIDNVRRIYFAGGEPLLMPEHWQILDMLVAKERFDVKLSYNTNCSTLSYGKKNIMDYWSKWQFGKLEIWPSIDEVGPRAELIRAGTVWPKVEENLKKLSELDNIILRPGLTIGAFNVFRLPEIITHLVDIGVIKRDPKRRSLNYNNFFINLLESPIYYHVNVLPDDFKNEIIIKLENFVAEFNEKYNTNISKLFEHILFELTKPFNVAAAKHFVRQTRKLDDLRGENTYEVIPELQAIKEALHVEN